MWRRPAQIAPHNLASTATVAAFANLEALSRPKGVPPKNVIEARPAVKLTDLTSSNLIVKAPMTSSSYNLEEVMERKRSLMSPVVEQKKAQLVTSSHTVLDVIIVEIPLLTPVGLKVFSFKRRVEESFAFYWRNLQVNRTY